MSGQGSRGGGRGGFFADARGGDNFGRDRGGRGGGRGDGRGGGRGDRGGRGGFRGGGRGDSSRGGGGGDRGRGGDRGGRGGGRGRGKEKIIFRPGETPAPDTKVTNLEDQIAKDAKSAMPKTEQLSVSSKFPHRPAFGTKGKAVTLWANFMQLVPTGQQTLFRYNVEFQKDEKGVEPVGKKCGRLIDILLEENFAAVRNKIATDFRSTMVSSAEIPFSDEPYRVQYRLEGEEEAGEHAKTYRVRIQSTGTLTVSELMNYLTSSNAGDLLGSKEEVIQALNIVVGNYPKSASHIFSMGANKHYPHKGELYENFNLNCGLEALRGFFVSVRAATARLLVNVQVKNTPCYQPIRLDHLMQDFTRGNRSAYTTSGLDRFLKRIRVQVTHIVRKTKSGKEIPRVKVISGLATQRDGQGQPNPPIVSGYGAGPDKVQFFLSPPESSGGPPAGGAKKGKKGKPQPGGKPGGGQSSDGGYITVSDFFKQTYNMKVAPGVPVVNVGNLQNPMYLPAEVCMVLPGQPSNAKLSPSQTAQMIKFAVRKPVFNAESIVTSGAQVIGATPQLNSCLTNFNLSIVPQLITVPGRVLQSPAVKYSGSSTANTRNGSWNMAQVKFSKTVNLPTWTYLWISHQRDDVWADTNQVEETVGEFNTEMVARGIGTTQLLKPGLRLSGWDYNNPNVLADKIDDAFEKIAAHPRKPKVVLVILPKSDTVIYNRVKFMGDVRKGIHTICVIGSKLAKKNPYNGNPDVQYFANVALKFNLKLGGANQWLDTNKLGIVAQKKTMVVGLDVTHPSPGSSSKAPSVVGIVASVDSTLAQWPADLRIQEARQEMVSELDILLKSRLQLWRQRNGALPENIILYRDGISEGQYNLAREQEVPLLRKACQAMYPANDTKKGLPRISVVVVGKRHNTRFYPTNEGDADDSSNPQNGTVVDRGVTEARNWDFFLQAHTALHGTARPAHYYVVLDEVFRKGAKPSVNAADDLEDLTHNMCYLFGRATKAVSVCPPAYYADLVCERARCYLSGLYDASATPSASIAGSSAAGGQEASANDVAIHPSLKDSMFYL